MAVFCQPFRCQRDRFVVYVYALFSDPSSQPQPPALQFIPNQTGVESSDISFIVQAYDADGSYPTISASPLPAGATFTPQGQANGLTTAVFDWTPIVGQAGQYAITYTAANGTLTTSQQASIQVNSAVNTNNNGIPDWWEIKWFGQLIDASADASGDGLTNLQKYQLGLNPLVSHVPTVPTIASPVNQGRAPEFTPDLAVLNSTVPDGLAITYAFEVYSDQPMTNMVASVSGVMSGTNTTSWMVPARTLSEDTWYYWRVKATALSCTSKWANASFFVNTVSHPPGPFNISSPVNGSQVNTYMPVLSVTNSTDVNQYPLTYTFQVYSDHAMTNLVVASPAVPQNPSGTTSWTVNVQLQEGAWYYWNCVASAPNASTPSASASFLVNALVQPPAAPAIASPAQGATVAATAVALTVNNAFDADNDTLSYSFEIDTVNTFDSPSMQMSGSVPSGAAQTLWNVSGLSDHTQYYWRACAFDGQIQGPWSVGNFFVDIVHVPPSVPTVLNPGDRSWVVTPPPPCR